MHSNSIPSKRLASRLFERLFSLIGLEFEDVFYVCNYFLPKLLNKCDS